MTREEATTIARALRLFNEKPRFGPRDRRGEYDSYSVAAELQAMLRSHGYDPYHSFPQENP